ncbi:MAG: hypothetical protein KJP00_01435 [Bacteroidia bacterium]|nr:hypothetical protein [Bacteroidia bacterium]
MKIIYIAIILILPTLGLCQFDKDRMHRDLEVAENALSTLLSTDSNYEYRRVGLFGGSNVEGEFIKDYGVIFTIGGRGFAPYTRASYALAQAKEAMESEKAALAEVQREKEIAGQKMKEAKEKMKVKEEMIKAEKEQMQRYKEQMKRLGQAEVKIRGMNTQEVNEDMIDKIQVFLADYARIIGQLNDNHKIVVKIGHGSGSFAPMVTTVDRSDESIIWAERSLQSAGRGGTEITIEVSVGKINELSQGKITRDAFFEQVSVTKMEIDNSRDADLETLTAMFHRLYQKDLSKTYFTSFKPSYSKLSNFGSIISMKLYSSNVLNDELYSMPTIGKDKMTREERNKEVMAMLPEFEKEFKENIVNYARTIKNLNEDESLLFEVTMTACDDCKDFPKKMKFTIQQSVLQKYNKGAISIPDAVRNIEVERIMD